MSPTASASTTFTIGELAREFDLTTRAIRFYEDCGLLTPQRSGRNRVYTARDRTRLKLTLRGKRLGLTLAEVKELVDMYESPRDTQPQLKKFLVVLARTARSSSSRWPTCTSRSTRCARTRRKAKRLLRKAARKEQRAHRR
jgi:DNA-binding transcriptional MerR regulator